MMFFVIGEFIGPLGAVSVKKARNLFLTFCALSFCYGHMGFYQCSIFSSVHLDISFYFIIGCYGYYNKFSNFEFVVGCYCFLFFYYLVN